MIGELAVVASIWTAGLFAVVLVICTFDVKPSARNKDHPAAFAITKVIFILPLTITALMLFLIGAEMIP